MKSLTKHLKAIGLVIQIAPFDWRWPLAAKDNGCVALVVGPITIEVWYS